MSKFVLRTTDEAVYLYESTNDIFDGLIKEVRELSKKKPDAILSKGKVKIINRVLTDLQTVLEHEPEKKFLDLLDDEDLPQTSDAVLIMVQYESVLADFPRRYKRPVRVAQLDYGGYRSKNMWITESFNKNDFPLEAEEDE